MRPGCDDWKITGNQVSTPDWSKHAGTCSRWRTKNCGPTNKGERNWRSDSSDRRAAKPKEADWTLLLETIDLVYDDFATRFRQLSDRLNEKEIRTACLIKIGLPPAMIARRLFCTKTNISMIRRRIYEKIFGEKGSSEQCDQFIVSF